MTISLDNNHHHNQYGGDGGSGGDCDGGGGGLYDSRDIYLLKLRDCSEIRGAIWP